MRLHSMAIIAVISAVTVLIRFLPFFVFPPGKEPPAFISRLTKLLPSAVIGMLVVYCLRGISFAESPYGLPELISSAAVVLVHKLRRNTLLSILTGTLCYMLLIRVL